MLAVAQEAIDACTLGGAYVIVDKELILLKRCW
jgi:hypothetical protein